MSDLIAAVFDDAHTAFLARAALARLQTELSLPGHDLAVVTREKGGEIVLQEATVLNDDREMQPTCWKTLVSLLFAPNHSAGEGRDPASEKLAVLGIDATFRSRLAGQIQADTSALFARVTGPTMRDRVIGMLRGFQGEIMLTGLAGDECEACLSSILGTEPMDKMQ